MSDPGLSAWFASGVVSALAVAFPLVVSMVTGWAIVGAVVVRGGDLEAVSGRNFWFASGVLRVGVGGLLGLWLGSMVMFGVRLAGVGQGSSAVVVGVLDGIWVVLAMLAAWWRGGLGVGISSEKAGFMGLLRRWMRASIGVWLLRGTLVAACVLTLFHARAAYLQGPFGAFDAIAIWNTKARFLSDSELWRGVFSPLISWTHPDYPLLLPLNVARLWSYTGLCGQGEPAWCGLVLGLVYLGLALMIVGATVSLMVAKQRDLSGSSEGGCEAWGLVAALAILGSPGVQAAAVSQMADLPVGAALAGAVACSILATCVTQTPEKSGLGSNQSVAWAGLAGLLAGAAAWTKNEGQLMALAVGLAVLWAGVIVPLIGSFLAKNPGSKSNIRHGLWLIAAFVLAFVPTGLVLLGMKLWLVPANDLLQDQSVAGLSRLIEPARHMQIISGYAVAAKVALGWPLLVVVGVTLVTTIFQRDQRRWAATGALAIPGAALVLILAGEYGVYLLTPHDLAWHLQTSADRLLVQLWPTMVMTLALACSRSIRPAEADSTKLSAGTLPGV
jgi:hypothetical protein